MQSVLSGFSMKTSLGRGLLAVAMGLFVVSCTDSGPTQSSVDRLLPVQNAFNGFNGGGACMDDDNDAFGGGGPINCTSNDIEIAETFVTSVNGAAFNPATDELLCTPGETINLGLTLRLEETANSSRQDVGIWVASDKDVDAHFGQCNHYTIDANAPGVLNEADPDEVDSCAGINEGAFFDFPLTGPTIPALCPASGNVITIGACVAWNVPADDPKIFCPAPTPDPDDPSLGYREASLPTNAAKCNCDPFTITVTLAGSITITKDAIPNNAQDFSYTATGGGMSNFVLDDDAGAPGADATNLASKNFPTLNPNVGDPRVITETVPAGWVITDIVCTGATNSTVTIGAAGGFDAGDNSVSINLASGEHVSCRFDNTMQASLDIEKISLGGSGTFDYVGTGTGVTANFTRGPTTAGVQTVTAPMTLNGANAGGDKYVQETAETGFTLTNIACTADGATIVIGRGGSGAFVDGGGAGYQQGDNTVKVTLAPGSDPQCVFTNTADAAIDIEKVSLGGTGTFDFVETGPCFGANFQRTTTTAGVATTTAAVTCTAPFTDQFVQETPVPTGWALTNITCSGGTFVIGSGGSGAFVNGGGDGFNAGDNTVKITPTAGVTTSCTFENTRTATLAIQKQTIGGTGTFDFVGTGAGVTANFSRNTAGANPTTDAPFAISVANFGTKYVQETVPAGYTLTAINCTANGAVIVIGSGGSGAFAQGTTTGFDAGDNTVQVAIDAGDTPTCTFVNTAQSSLDVEKSTLGGTASFDYTVNGTGLAPFSRNTGVNNPTVNSPFSFSGTDAVATKYVTETALTGWVLTAINCTLGGAEITYGTGQGGAFAQGTSAGFDPGDNTIRVVLTAGDNPSCTFVNTKQAKVQVIKTLSGAAITGTETFTFTLRSGATTVLPGDILQTLVANSTNGGTLNFTPFLTLGSTYQICEIVLAGWNSTISGMTGAFVIQTEPDGDNSTICVPFTPTTPGETVVININNTPPPGGDARTIGYWKNWNSCSKSNGKQTDQLGAALAAAGGSFTLGDLVVDTCEEAVAILNKSTVGANSKKMASDPAYNMAAQLMAALLNKAAGAEVCQDAQDAIDDALALLDAINFTGTGSYKNAAGIDGANAIAATLDEYNNNTLCN
jgi:hypothetical protein